MQKMQSMLIVKSIGETQVASDGRNWKQIKFQPKNYTPAGEEILSNDPVRSRNIWELGPPSAKGKKDFSAGDPLFATARVGSVVGGFIQHGTVDQYLIGDEPQNTVTIVLFTHEKNNLPGAFKRQGYTLIDTETGEVFTGRAQVTAQSPQEALVASED